MKSPFLHLLPIILLVLKQTLSESHSSSTNEEFRPSRLIFESKKSPGSSPVVNSFNVTVAYPQRGEVEDVEVSGTFSHPVSEVAEGRTSEGRTLFGGWAGVGNTYCQNHHEFNPACCSLGYSNCCAGSSGFHKKPNYHSSGWGGFYQNNNHHHHHHGHNEHRYPVYHKPPPTPIHRPLLPVVPIRPLPRPIVRLPARPIVHPHPLPTHHHHFQGSSGWGPGVEKPGSCKSTFSFLSKLNFLSKAKDIFGKGEGGHKGGWGWEPPSHNGGWHFYRRSDSSFPQTPFLTKRQVPFEGHQNNHGGILRSLSNVFVIGGGRGEKESSDNAILQRAKSSFYEQPNNAVRFSSAADTAKAGSSWGPSGGSPHPFEFQGRSVHASSQYYGTPRSVGIGSISGRVLGGGGGWGWNNNHNQQHHRHCRIDYDCPGNDKCCEGICSPPSFFG